jgi:hypothetical protein
LGSMASASVDALSGFGTLPGLPSGLTTCVCAQPERQLREQQQPVLHRGMEFKVARHRKLLQNEKQLTVNHCQACS